MLYPTRNLAGKNQHLCITFISLTVLDHGTGKNLLGLHFYSLSDSCLDIDIQYAIYSRAIRDVHYIEF